MDSKRGVPALVDDGTANARRWNVIALLVALLTSLAAVLLPVMSHSSTDSNGVTTSGTESLLSDVGPRVLVLAAIPLVLIALPLLMRSARAAYLTRVGATVLLGALVVLGAASIGLFVIPTAAAMVMSLSADNATRRNDATRPASLPPLPPIQRTTSEG